MPDASVLRACACLLSTKEETRTLHALVPAWSRSSRLTSRGPREVFPALISPPLASLLGEAAPEEVLRHPPREAWPLARVLNALSMKRGRTDLPAQPRHGPQAGKSGDPHSQNADSSHLLMIVTLQLIHCLISLHAYRRMNAMIIAMIPLIRLKYPFLMMLVMLVAMMPI